MDRTGVVRRIAAVVGGVVVMMGAWSCSGDPTGPRFVEWTAGAGAGPAGSRPGGPGAPIGVAQTLRQGAATSAPPPSGIAVRATRP